MFQTFDAKTTPKTAAPRLAQLRDVLRENGFDGFLIPRADAHQGEYVVARDMRLAWLTSFTGSAGFCAALLNNAGLFVDGRYTIQARDQVDTDLFSIQKFPDVKLGNWLVDALPDGGKVAFDPWLYTKAQIEEIEKHIAGRGVELVKSENLIDQIWDDQPQAPRDKMHAHPMEFAGKPHGEKRSQIAQVLRDAKQSGVVLTQPDSIAWLLNTRGSDLGQTPVALCFAMLFQDGRVALFIDPQKVDDDLREHLGADVAIHDLGDLSAELIRNLGPIRVDPKTTPIAILDILQNGDVKVDFGDDPITLPKATKNTVEIDGAIAAHIRDGAAVCEFLAWLDGYDHSEPLSEIDVVKSLESFRAATNQLRNISFDTISGAGPNGAIVHYRVNEDTNRTISQDDLLLVDSGAQYLDGTTDITRTIAIGKPKREAKRAFTLVLQGMIGISKLRFPVGLSGREIDAIARAPLWSAGLDFDHGTGHGVGSYLSVHEGPQGISRRSNAPLREGMILSNEPGYYKEGAFGIRIENLIYVKSAPVIRGGDARDMYCFETLTLAPIDLRLIDRTMLNSDERDWINAYHTRVFEALFDQCSARAQDYLTMACAPI
ncbi:Xaa-Pro aminopeptidase [Amylibacter ulvae]|uniref:Xaa-Pro aminopeptidase n=1 Tax=Paramylibacter ulvae TaxID=1651968 RepID=A0ABQ3D4Q8_9RHOB|nr:aminopeptidase P family protein [Amylibacter ulvae]GHA52804.1 Xaa-Pro aminopeptidase [Amylibacter ulvae]